MTKRLLSLALAVMMVLSLCTFCVFAEIEVPEEIETAAGKDGVDDGAILTLFDEPVSTTWGTKANVLPEGYTFETDGKYGLTLIFKFEGTKPGTIFGKIDANVTTMRTTNNNAVDENGEPVLDEDGNPVKEVVEETRGPIWNGNWVHDGYSTNSIQLWGDGIYLYYFPFRNIDNAWTNVPSVAGKTKVNSLAIFNQAGALGNGRAAGIVSDETMTATCLGVLEGDITKYDVYAYNKLTDEYEVKDSGVSINGKSNSNYAQWKKLPDLTQLFGVNFGAEENEYITGWLDRDGEAVGETDIVKIVEPAYAEFNEEDLINVTFLDAYGAELATVKGLKGKGLIENVPAAPEKATNAIEVFRFKSWTIDGEVVSDPASYKYKGDTTVVPSYNQFGMLFTDNEPVALPYGEALAPTEVLPVDSVALGGLIPGVTLVYKVEGADEEIIADDFLVTRNGEMKNPAWAWNSLVDRDSEGTKMNCANITLNNGYYYIFLNRWVLANGATVDTIDNVLLFNVGGEHWTNQIEGREPVNNNENATFQLLAVANGNLQPTVTFHGNDGEVLGSYTHKYTAINANSADNKNNWADGELITLEDVQELAEVETPSKVGEIAEVIYEFDGWVDAAGNKYEYLYVGGDYYPSYKVTDLRTKYNVEFQNYDGTVLHSAVVPEGVTPEFVGATPEKPSTDTNSFVFKGWTPEIAAMPETPEADGATAAEKVVYTAEYETVERRYNVTFYDEDGETILDKALNVIANTAATTDVLPEKDADVQYSYTFEKWVDLEGNDVDLTKVNADLEVKPAFKATLNKYTVTFYNEDKTELGSSTVDYGTAATAPEATKESTQWYNYIFDKWVGEDGNEVDITEVKGDVDVYATYTDEFISPYPGEAWPNWAQDAIEYVLINEIMNGMDGGFKPNTTMNRAMVVTVLYRYMDEPEYEVPEDFVNFTDNLNTESWYYDAVIWAAVNGVVNGKGAGKFDPMGNVTRQEFAAILYRFSDEVMGEYMGYGRSTLSAFYDREQIDKWAHAAVKWAYATAEDTDTQGSRAYNKNQYITGAGVMNGKVVFAPKANATRAQVATMLYRYMTGERIKAD